MADRTGVIARNGSGVGVDSIAEFEHAVACQRAENDRVGANKPHDAILESKGQAGEIGVARYLKYDVRSDAQSARRRCQRKRR